jgi:hypothetical protein
MMMHSQPSKCLEMIAISCISCYACSTMVMVPVPFSKLRDWNSVEKMSGATSLYPMLGLVICSA